MGKELSQLEVMDRMVKENNRSIAFFPTIVDVRAVSQGRIVGFGVVEEIAKDANVQVLGLPGEYMFLCFSVKRTEFEKTKQAIIDSSNNEKSKLIELSEKVEDLVEEHGIDSLIGIQPDDEDLLREIGELTASAFGLLSY